MIVFPDLFPHAKIRRNLTFGDEAIGFERLNEADLFWYWCANPLCGDAPLSIPKRHFFSVGGDHYRIGVLYGGAVGVKALLRIFRPSRKLVIVIAGAALLMGGSGALAVYFGAQKYVGLPSKSADGLACTDVNLVTIHKQNHLWVRKYITTEPTDGVTRVRTALRVAAAIYAQQKPDLVQVVVLDKNGPTLRSDIRGRALGADVVFVPDPSKVGEGSVTTPYTARYYDGGASDEGLFYGERVDMQPKDIDGMMASLGDKSDCLDPVAAEASKDGGKEKKKKGEATEEKAEATTKGHEPDKGHGADAPPAQHPEPAHDSSKPDEKSTGFIGASADAPASTLQTAETGHPVLVHADEAAAGHPGTDPQTTGASERRSPVTN
jgi:hypothetical protein